MAQASVSDCDGDGDPDDTLDPLECGGSLQKPEPGKLFSKGEKHAFEEAALNYARTYAKLCGVSTAAALSKYAVLATFGLGNGVVFSALCVVLVDQQEHNEALAKDPPDPAVLTVALPKRPKSVKRAASAAGRRYLIAAGQKAAFGEALATSLNRLSSTPEAPEELTATPVPKYSRRLQVGAGRVYSGLVAAWGEREASARAQLLALLRRHSAAGARQAATVLPRSANTKALWGAFKSLTAPEYAQLSADLYQQVIEDQFVKDLEKIAAEAPASPQQAKKEFEALQPVQESFRSSKTAMFADLGALLEASESSTGNLEPPAKAAIKEAAKLPKVPGLTKFAPQAGLVARLASFGAGAFLPGKPKPFPAG